MGAFGLADPEFWSAPFRTKGEVQRRLSREGKEGVFVDGPARVPLDGRTDLPLVGCRVVSLRDAKATSFDKTALVTAVHLDDGRHHVALVYPPRVRDPSMPAPEDDGEDPGVGKIYRMFTLDVHERLPALRWAKGTILTTLLLRDQASERVRSELVAPVVTGYVDPVVAEAEAAAPPPERPPLRVFPAPKDPLPSYTRDPRAPAAPAAPGLAVAAPRKALASGQLVVRGAFQVPLLPHQLVEGDPVAKAIVPVTLALTGEVTPGPFVLELGVPILEAPAKDQPAKGHFALDLFAHPAMTRKKQKYWLWAFAGAAMAGPHEVVIA